MEPIHDNDLFDIEELLKDGNDLRLLTNDWPGNDPLSNSSNDSQVPYSVIDDYFQQTNSQEAFTPSTDSGNHSPTSSSSDGGTQNPMSWNHYEDVNFDDIQAYIANDQSLDQAPPQADLDAIEKLLNNRDEDIYIEHLSSPANSSPPLILGNNYVYQQPAHLPSISRGTNRSQPYILPKPIQKTEKSVSPPVQFITTPTPQLQQPQTVYFTPNNVQLIQTLVPSQPNAIYVPSSSLASTVGLERKESIASVAKVRTPEDEDYARKCENRKFKNRAAAQQSRERKKAELETFKATISKLQQENEELKKENSRLKARVTQLEGFFVVPQAPKRNVVKAVGVSLMVVMMLVSFPGAMKNFSPTTIEADTEHIRQIRAIPNINDTQTAIAHIGSRSLLAVEDYDGGEDLPPAFIDSKASTTNATKPKTAGSCPNNFLNATERIRVNNELISWIDRHEKMNLVQLRSGKSPFLIYNSQKVLFPPGNGNETKLSGNSTELVNVSHHHSHHGAIRRRHKESGHQKTLRERAWRHIEMINAPIGPKPLHEDQPTIGGTELAVPISIQEQIMKQLAAQLKQKDDMMYVMALKDYFILPRTATNSTELPKLSIVLPALAINSSQPNHLTMMRIECSVTSTSIFFLPDRLVSLFNGSSN